MKSVRWMTTTLALLLILPGCGGPPRAEDRVGSMQTPAPMPQAPRAASSRPLSEGDFAPDFSLTDQYGTPHYLSDYAGMWVVLHFFPGADAPHCTCDATAFTELLQNLNAISSEVVCINDDTPGNLDFYSIKYELELTLLSDPKHRIGRRYLGTPADSVYRGTFLIDPDGRIAHRWIEIDPAAHVGAIEQAIADRQAAY